MGQDEERRMGGEQPPCHRSQQALITHGRVGSLVWSVGGYSSSRRWCIASAEIMFLGGPTTIRPDANGGVY